MLPATDKAPRQSEDPSGHDASALMKHHGQMKGPLPLVQEAHCRHRHRAFFDFKHGAVTVASGCTRRTGMLAMSRAVRGGARSSEGRRPALQRALVPPGAVLRARAWPRGNWLQGPLLRAASTSDSRWGVPGGKKARKRAKDSVDGGPVKVAEEDETEWLAICEELKAKAKSLGLGPTSITTSEPSGRLAAFEQWIEQGYHGEMGFLARPDRMARRRDLSEILPGVQAVIVSSLVYWPGQNGFPPQLQEATRGNVSCYAWGDDYHEILGHKLRELATWLHLRAGGTGRWYVDTGAIMERDLGERAGLGFVGKNSLLIAPKIGSGFFLGEILTTLALPADKTRKSRAGCGKCTRCMDACPTNAFVAPYVLDARRCISYLTIEHKGSIPHHLREAMSNRIYGCDVCQQVCPWNKFDWGDSDGSPLFGRAQIEVAAPELRELLVMDEPHFKRHFASSAALRIGLRRMVRNAAVAAGNSRDASLIPPLTQVLFFLFFLLYRLGTLAMHPSFRPLPRSFFLFSFLFFFFVFFLLL